MKWIRASDYYPALIGHYLILKKERVMIGYFNGINWTIGKYAKDDISKVITFWQNLPEPPTKD